MRFFTSAVCLALLLGAVCADDPAAGDVRITVDTLIEGDPPSVEVSAVVCVYDDEGACSYEDADDMEIEFECISPGCVEGMIGESIVHVQGGDVTTLFYFKGLRGTWDVKIKPVDDTEGAFAATTTVKTDRVNMALEVLEGGEQELPKGNEAETIVVQLTDSETGEIVDPDYPVDWEFEDMNLGWEVDCEMNENVCTTYTNAEGKAILKVTAGESSGIIKVHPDGSVFEPVAITFTVYDCADFEGCNDCVAKNGCGYCYVDDGACEDASTTGCPEEEFSQYDGECKGGSLAPIFGTLGAIVAAGAGSTVAIVAAQKKKEREAAEAGGEDGGEAGSYKAPLIEPTEKAEPL